MRSAPPALLEHLLLTRRKYSLPAQLRPMALQFGPQVLGMLFPHYSGSVVCSEEAIEDDVIRVAESLGHLERAIGTLHEVMPEQLVERFLDGLPAVVDTLEADAQAILEGDPAARSYDEVVLTYPGFYAIAVYRIAHLLWTLGLPLLPRLLTEFAHEKTGIDIHPGAHIGRRFCIDHGTGVVVGETAVIGDRVRLYQGVTLGAKSFPLDEHGKPIKGIDRHPIVEDDVVIYSGATILGRIVIGKGSSIGGNVWLTQPVPPNSRITQPEVREPARAGPGLGG